MNSKAKTVLLIAIFTAVVSLSVRESQSAESKVDDSASLRKAMTQVKPGDEIVLKAGRYPLDNHLSTRVDGTDDQPIVMRTAGKKGYAVIHADGQIAFRVQNKNWKFSGIHFQGNPKTTEAAVFMDGPRGCGKVTIVDCKISDSSAYGMKTARGVDHAVDDIRVEFTEVYNIGDTALDIVGGDRLDIRRNYIHDFGLNGSTHYGIFLKGGGSNGIVEGNYVDGKHLSGAVGISFGGGLTGKQFMPLIDGKSPPEHQGGICRNNVVVNTGDAAYHSNNADGCAYYNNLAYDCATGFQRQKSQGTDPLLIDNVIGKIRGASDESSHNIEAGRPEWYRNPDKRDFRLTEEGEEVMRQSAIAVADNPTGLFGSPRDEADPICGPILPGATEKSVWQDRRK